MRLFGCEGQTGSGKTFTMGTGGVRCGDASRAGVVPRLAHDLFERGAVLSSMHVSVSVLEIYGEELRDLLVDGQPNKLLIRQDPQGDIFVTGLTEVAVDSAHSLLHVLDQGAPRSCCTLHLAIGVWYAATLRTPPVQAASSAPQPAPT